MLFYDNMIFPVIFVTQKITDKVSREREREDYHVLAHVWRESRNAIREENRRLLCLIYKLVGIMRESCQNDLSAAKRSLADKTRVTQG